MAAITHTQINCRDCGEPVIIPVSIQSTPGPIDAAVYALSIGVTEATEIFTAHVMADPENHPTFAIPVDADTGE